MLSPPFLELDVTAAVAAVAAAATVVVATATTCLDELASEDTMWIQRVRAKHRADELDLGDVCRRWRRAVHS